jgi:hypothetical protein
MKHFKALLSVSLCLLGNLATQHVIASDSGITRIEAVDISFEQSHLCPYPIKLEAKVYNDLKIAGLKKFRYRWILNDDVYLDNGRFTVYPSSYGTGYDKQHELVKVGKAPINTEQAAKDAEFSFKKYFNRTHDIPAEGWYQLMVLPEDNYSWRYAVKSNKANYKITCNTE